MRTINQVIEEGKKEFETGKFKDFYPYEGSGATRYEIIEFFTEYTTSLLKAVEEMCEEKAWNCGDRLSPETVVTLDDLKTALNSLIEKI